MGEGTLTSFNRIESIDVLRGFALAGILYAHMIIWYTGSALPTEVYTNYDSIADGIAMGIFGGLVYGKFFSVFSFLFGLSFFLHFSKKKSKPGYIKIYIWRLVLLFLIGIVHHVIWRGDILAIYAVLGVFLLFFRRFSPIVLLIISLLLIFNLPTHIYNAFFTKSVEASVSFPMQEEANQYYSLVKNGSFIAVLQENWNSLPSKIEYQLESGRLMMTFGYFLLGFYAGRTSLFTSIGRNFSRFSEWNKYSGRCALFLLLIGWLMYVNEYVTLPAINVVPEYKGVAAFLFDLYNGFVTIFYITGVVILFRRRYFQSFLKPLAAMGRMALTNYLLQTGFGLILFYHFGLGYFDKTSLAVNVILAVAILYLQLKFSKWWLKHYKQGPVEWVWKSLTYFNISSIKRIKKSKISKVPESDSVI